MAARPPPEDHLAKVRAWLEENTRVYAGPSEIILRNIRFDVERQRGAAQLILGDQGAEGEELSLHIQGNGWLTYQLPMFHSPLGAPASYGAVSLSATTKQALDEAVRSLMPRFLPFGLHPASGEWITQSTPLHQRVLDIPAFNQAVKQLDETGFEVRRPVAQP